MHTSSDVVDLSTPGKKKWSKIMNVLKGVSLFSSYDVKVITKPVNIDISYNQLNSADDFSFFHQLHPTKTERH